MRAFMFWGWLLFASVPGHAAIILSLDSAAQSVPLGSEYGVDLNISGLGNGVALGAYDFAVGFDPGVLAFSTAVFGNGLNLTGLGSIQTIMPGPGSVEIFELSFDSPDDLITLQPSSFNLMTLLFNTLSTHQASPITLTSLGVGDAYGSALSVTLHDATVSVTPVSEPETFALMLVGLVALGWFKKRSLNSDKPSIAK
jgi:hypothetical protein